MTSSSERVPLAQRGQVIHKVLPYGTSVLGTPLEIFMPIHHTPSMLIMAGQHGDESETTVVLSSALRSIHPSQLRCAVILAVNPDGLARGTRGNARGVDLNRNFPAQNWQSGLVLHSWYDDSPKGVELSTGTHPCSEPETEALLKLLRSHTFKNIISLHSRLGCVDDPDASLLAHWLSQETGLPHVRHIGYPTPGSFGSWAIENAIPLITLELPDESIIAMSPKIRPVLETLLIHAENYSA